MSGKAIPSIWAGDVITFHLPTDRLNDNPLPPPNAPVRGWSVDAGLREGDRIVLHHIANVSGLITRPDGKKDIRIDIRKTTRTQNLSGYSTMPTPEWAQLPADVEAPGPTDDWVKRRAELPKPSAGTVIADQIPPPVDPVIDEKTTVDPVLAKNTVAQVTQFAKETLGGDVKVVPIISSDPQVATGFMTVEELIERGSGEITLNETATYLGIVPAHVEKLISDGSLTARVLGDTKLIDAGSVARYEQELARAKRNEYVESNPVCAVPGPQRSRCELPRAHRAESNMHEGGGFRWDFVHRATHMDGTPLRDGELLAADSYFAGDEPVAPTSAPEPADGMPTPIDTLMFAAVDNANERLHNGNTTVQRENSTLWQCLGRLRGVIEVKVGAQIVADETDPLALTNAMVTALAPSMAKHKPVIGVQEARRTVQEIVERPMTKPSVDVAVDVAAAAQTNSESPPIGSDEWMQRARAVDKDIKDLNKCLKDGSTVLDEPVNPMFDEIGKSHHTPG